MTGYTGKEFVYTGEGFARIYKFFDMGIRSICNFDTLQTNSYIQVSTEQHVQF